VHRVRLKIPRCGVSSEREQDPIRVPAGRHTPKWLSAKWRRHAKIAVRKCILVPRRETRYVSEANCHGQHCMAVENQSFDRGIRHCMCLVVFGCWTTSSKSSSFGFSYITNSVGSQGKLMQTRPHPKRAHTRNNYQKGYPNTLSI
jgi:hypothetical protein